MHFGTNQPLDHGTTRIDIRRKYRWPHKPCSYHGNTTEMHMIDTALSSSAGRGLDQHLPSKGKTSYTLHIPKITHHDVSVAGTTCDRNTIPSLDGSRSGWRSESSVQDHIRLTGRKASSRDQPLQAGLSWTFCRQNRVVRVAESVSAADAVVWAWSFCAYSDGIPTRDARVVFRVVPIGVG